MNAFTYYTPTQVVFGNDSHWQVGQLIQQRQYRKILIHYGGGSAIRSGLLAQIEASLQNADIDYVTLGGVVPNPRLSLVYQGIELCRKEKVDFVLAVGGGSVIDSAKAICYGVANDFDVWDLYDRKAQATACLPLGVILTIAAAGSEMSDSSVITKDPQGIKRGYSNDLCRPCFAVMNPALTLTLPAYQTACGCTDILMHTMERYFTGKGNLEITDALAEGLMKTVIHYAKILKNEPQNNRARWEVMWAGSLSHNGLTGCGNGGNDFSTHGLEHELSGMFDVAHGAGLAAVWGSWARYVFEDCLDRFYRYAVRVMDVPEGEAKSVALQGIEKTEAFFRYIGMPTSLKELGLSPTCEQLELLAENVAIAYGGKKGSAKVLRKPDMLAIYQNALL